MISTLSKVSLALCVLSFAMQSALAQDPAAAAGDAAAAGFSQEQLEQMVAPIALYPDNLVSNVFMASTYPLEVVEAERWLEQNKALAADARDKALQEQQWDPAVKSVVAVPEVLKRMSTNLDWTRDLGDAFLGQQAELMKAVQKLRDMANDAGNLKTTEQQQVKVEQETIIIESTNPETIYVPEYSTEVYGSSYSYPQPYYSDMYQPGWGLLGFGAGVVVGGAIWGNCNWGAGNCDVNVNNFNNYNKRVNSNWQNQNNWGHQVDHRKGVGYKDNKVAQKYGGKQGANNRVGNDKARGKAGGAGGAGGVGGAGKPGGAGGAGKPGGVGGAGGAGKPGGVGGAGGAGGAGKPGGVGGAGGAGGAGKPGGVGGAGGAGAGAGAGGGQRPAAKPAQQPSRSSSGMSGSSQPKSDRSASQRGSSSRSGSSGGGGGGGGRGGGGGGRGGGGRR